MPLTSVSRRRYRLTVALFSFLMVLTTLSWLTGVAPKPLSARADTCSAGDDFQIQVSPCEGAPGSSVVVQTNMVCSPTAANNPLVIWDGASAVGEFAADEPETVDVPSSASPGAHTITDDCSNGNQSTSVTFTVTDPTTTDPTTTDPTTTDPTTTDPTTTDPTTTSTTPSTQPTTQPTTVSTTPTTGSTGVKPTTPSTVATTTTTRTTGDTTSSTGETSTSATTTTGASTSATSTSTPSSPSTDSSTVTTTPSTGSTTSTGHLQGTPTTVSSTAATTTPGHVLKLSNLSVSPGQDVRASGKGCAAGQKVALSIGGAAIGTAVAAADGTYQASLHIESVPVGRYTVTAHCGPVLADASLDVVLASQVNADTSTLSIIVFVILLGAFFYRRRLLPQARPHRPRSSHENP